MRGKRNVTKMEEINEFHYSRPSKIGILLSVTRAHRIKGRAFTLFTTKSPHLGILFAFFALSSHNTPISLRKP